MRPVAGRGDLRSRCGGVRRPAPSARSRVHVVVARPSLSLVSTGRSHSFAGQLAGLLHPSGELSFVERVVLVDVEVAHFLWLGLARVASVGSGIGRPSSRGRGDHLYALYAFQKITARTHESRLPKSQ